ncbi:FAD-dependent oxidoreductase [Bacillus sp. Marseille-P3661]|uniref:FAD-dependent oxidoreductase n=1 Tax=Bacillus sp. Marseille-P3661 TaxID=1936234 RepID=UPI000C8639D5|nr:FAD-dependent oxidoreductase [Bacillus sp. Marseille-P3661]
MWKQTYIVGENHDYPEFAKVQVVVVGGGAAGIAAAETAARQGLDVLLIERYGFCGGAAVAGLSGTICGMYMSEENSKKPEQVVFGFTEKFRSALAAKGGITPPQKYGNTWVVTHDPFTWKQTAENLLLEQKVNILYHTQVIGVINEEDNIRGVIINTKSGLAAIHADVVIDASGDADVIYRAGYGYTMGKDGQIQNPTMIFKLSGVDVDRFTKFWGNDTISSIEVTNMINESNDNGEFDLPRSKIWIFPTPNKNELLVNATRVLGKDGRDLNVTDPIDHTEAEIMGRYQAKEYADFLKMRIKGCENSFLQDTGVEVGVRQTRSILGEERLTNEDVLSCRKRDDGIARSPWPIELHKGAKPKVEWLLNDYYEIPYKALLPIKGENLMVAGRCLSAEHEALASARVTAQCFEYGHAAGLAASQSIKENKTLRELDGRQIRELLNEDGARL